MKNAVTMMMGWMGLSQVVMALGGGQYLALHVTAAVVCLGCVALGVTVRR